MLTLPAFEYESPERLEDVLARLAEFPGACLLVAGGTDAVPNLKHRLHEPRRIVSLARVRELRFVRDEPDGLHLGPMLRLAELAELPAARAGFPSLAKAAGLVASPQIRNMGTLGGNLCLDTRCTYYNQTFFWREALGFCLKKDGERCHVVTQGRRCVAAHSSDVAPVLVALGALIGISGPGGAREVEADAFFVGDGVHNNVLQGDELVTRVTLPAASRGMRAAYGKLRPRGAIDFPMLSVAVVARGARPIESLRVVVGALGARPRVVGGLEGLAVGRNADETTFAAVAEAAHRQCQPLTNVAYDVEWRREMVRVFVHRGLREAFAGGPS